MTGELAGWNDGPAMQAIVAFVEQTIAQDVPVEDRVAVFDNDGTLWCEKPLPIQADFILRRLVAMAEADAGLRDTQPWKAAYERDFGWFATVIEEHYAGDDTNVRPLAAGVIAAHAGISVEEFEAQAHAFMHQTEHPTLGRSYLECTYAPMVALLDHLSAHGFRNYIVSGGGRDFMRPVTQRLYRIPRDRVIGSAIALEYRADERGGAVMRKPELDYLDDGAEKPIRIWSHIGHRPMLAAGNSNGDIPMLDYTRHDALPSLRLLVLHDDADREFNYTKGAERALEKADAHGWTVASIKHDWSTVF